jgi:hypothetical protein
MKPDVYKNIEIGLNWNILKEDIKIPENTIDQ